MKTVTQNFKDAQRAPAPFMVRQLWYKRRYWQESTKTYIWETNWTQYTEDKVVAVSDVTWQLDIQTLNEFKTSNVTVTLDNLTNQWRGDNPYGKFAKDAVSPIYGYEPFWTKFQIRAGLNYTAAGATTQTTEVVNVFTGVATEFTVDSSTGSMQITLTGEEALLIGGNAESVSTAVVNETLTGTVDGSNKVFTTAHNGVGIWVEGSDNGLTKRAGTDYSLSQLNDPLNPGKITFLVAPAVGHTIRGSYLYWKSTQKFEDLVTALLNQAGIPGANQFVSPVVFPSNIINTHIWQTQADWQGGTYTYVDTITIPNSITGIDGTLITWNSTTSGWTTDIVFGALGASASGLTFSTDAAHDSCQMAAYQANVGAVGTWSAQYTIDVTHAVAGTFGWVYHFFINNVNASGDYLSVNNSGYCIAFEYQNNRIRLGRMTGGSQSNLASFTIAGSSMGGTHTINVKRTAAGVFTVLFDGSTIMTATDLTYTTCADYGYGFRINDNVAGPRVIGTWLNTGFQVAQSPDGTGTWTSAAVDFGGTPTAWTQLLYTANTAGGGTVALYTATSADNITYDSFIALPGNGVPASTLRRYVKVKIIIDMTNGNAIVNNASIGSITTSTSITLANFTGMTCYDAITALANFANYEFGFDGSENFFFRPKNPGNTPVFTMMESDFNMRIVSKVNGYDRVYSKIRATYAGYLKDVSDDGLTYVGPLPRCGYNLLQVDGGNILISSDADVATGIAGSFFNYYRLPRRRVKVQCEIIPQLDISDVVQASFQDLNPTRWVIGDSSTYVGDQAKSLYGPDEQVLQPLPMKVVGMRIDTNQWQTEFDLEEVI